MCYLLLFVGQHGTMEDDNSFWLLDKNLKKRSFEARSDKDSWNILGYFYPVLHPETLGETHVYSFL